jgi:hypothetical protein
MSRIRDQLWFAPEVKFADLDWSGTRLPTQFRLRIDGFYLKPAISLAEAGHAFGAGVLVVCALDALAPLITGTTGVRARITGLCRSIPGLDENDNAFIFFEHFRNGLVHEARVKNGSEFSLEITCIAQRRHDRLIVNPRLLSLHASRQILDGFVRSLNRDPDKKKAFCKKLKKTFRYEIQN